MTCVGHLRATPTILCHLTQQQFASKFMLIIGENDNFEQQYMAKFEQLAAKYGVFVKYERDRAARDIGLHLTKDSKSGKKYVTNSLVWFQMKGIMTSSLSRKEMKRAKEVRLSLQVEHLRHWFLDKEPTQLVVYVESIDEFLVLNLQDYISRTWGRSILALDQKTATVVVPAYSVLDEQAFSILLRYADIAQWTRALDADYDDIQLVRRAFDILYAIGMADQRHVEHGISWKKWISKTRDELRVLERPAGMDDMADENWHLIHEHWQHGGISPEDSYPFLELFALEEYDPLTFTNRWGEEELVEDGMTITLQNRDKVFGENFANEYYEFIFGARLNDYGLKLFNYVMSLQKMGLVELTDTSKAGGFISIAPWHRRLV